MLMQAQLRMYFLMPKYAICLKCLVYSKPDFTSFMVDDMESSSAYILQQEKYTAKQITPNMETMMKAKKKRF